MMPRDRFAQNLVRARKSVGVTQQELADRADLHRAEISFLERGHREPRLGTLIKLSVVLGVGVEELAAGISWNAERQRFEYRK
jgi:transcriptional regulator with XRE-family HTH domain